jgi:hypothetical protein
MFVSDLRHFLDMPDDVPGQARRMAQHQGFVVRAATAGEAGASWVSALISDSLAPHHRRSRPEASRCAASPSHKAWSPRRQRGDAPRPVVNPL